MRSELRRMESLFDSGARNDLLEDRLFDLSASSLDSVKNVQTVLTAMASPTQTQLNSELKLQQFNEPSMSPAQSSQSSTLQTEIKSRKRPRESKPTFRQL